MSFDPNQTNQLSEKWRQKAKQKGGKSRDTTKGIPAKYRKQIYMEYLKKTENEG